MHDGIRWTPCAWNGSEIPQLVTKLCRSNAPWLRRRRTTADNNISRVHAFTLTAISRVTAVTDFIDSDVCRRYTTPLIRK